LHAARQTVHNIYDLDPGNTGQRIKILSAIPSIQTNSSKWLQHPRGLGSPQGEQ